LARSRRDLLIGLPVFSARMTPILANGTGPPLSATNSSASAAACHSGRC